eukprot:SAG31_NODE_37017_length_308_cov_0.741627_1_plen_70_part_01
MLLCPVQRTPARCVPAVPVVAAVVLLVAELSVFSFVAAPDALDVKPTSSHCSSRRRFAKIVSEVLPNLTD